VERRRLAHALLIEDEPAVRAMMRRTLLLGGHEVLEACSARTAFEALRTEKVDVILADLHLSDEDGIGVMLDIRRMHPAILLIAVSGSSKHDISERLEAAGLRRSVWWMVKPFVFGDLLALVDAALAA
jgi:two-component system KDP operon response regulator KdpE